MVDLLNSINPNPKKNLTSFETVFNPNQLRQCLTLICKMHYIKEKTTLRKFHEGSEGATVDVI